MKIWFPCADGFVSPLWESVAKVHLRNVWFRWFWTTSTLRTFNLNTLIFWQLREQCCQPSLHLHNLTTLLSMSFLSVLFIFWFGFSCMLFLFLFGFSPFEMGFHHSFFLVRIKIGANMAAAGCRFRGVEGQLATLSLTFFLLWFWLILNLFEMSSSSFRVIFGWFLLFLTKDKIEIYFYANWYNLRTQDFAQMVPAGRSRCRVLIDWKIKLCFLFWTSFLNLQFEIQRKMCVYPFRLTNFIENVKF